MPADLDTALRAAVRDVLPEWSEVGTGHLGHWRPDGAGRWSSPAPLRLTALAGMPVAPLATRLAAALGAALTEHLAVAGGRAVGVGEDGFLVVTPGVEDCAGAVTAVLAAGTAYGRPARPVSPMVVDPTVPQRRTRDNPLFVVMWAHARCCVALDRLAAGTGAEDCHVIPRIAAPSTSTSTAAATSTSTVRVLVLLLADLPRAVAAAGDDPREVLRRLHEVAGATHRWLDESDSAASDLAWPALVEAARQVLATGLDVLGLPAPTRL